jgi:putative FmdB family regulatory protein
MPWYDLICEDPGCAHEFDVLHGIREPHPDCPKCGKTARRDFKPGSLSLDGTSQQGWPRQCMSFAPVKGPDGKVRDMEFRNSREMAKYARSQRIDLG